MDHTTTYPPLPEAGSFSYSWPTSKPKPQPQPEEHVVQGDITTSSTVADPASASQCSFDFRLSVSDEQTETMAVADQMFLNGLLLPLHLASQHGQEDGHAGRKQQPALTRSLSLDSSQRMIASAATSRQHPPPPTRRSVSQNRSTFNLRGGTVTTASARGAVFRTSKLRLPSFGRCRRKQHRWISFRFLVPLYRKMLRCVWTGKATEEKAKDAAGGDKGKLCDLGQESAIRDAVLHCKSKLCDLGQESAIRDAVLHCKRSL